MLGCDAADVSAGGLDKAQQMPELKPGYQVEYARVVKKETGLVTFAVGLIKEPLQAEAILAAGDADGICVGREMLRTPTGGGPPHRPCTPWWPFRRLTFGPSDFS